MACEIAGHHQTEEEGLRAPKHIPPAPLGPAGCLGKLMGSRLRGGCEETKERKVGGTLFQQWEARGGPCVSGGPT